MAVIILVVVLTSVAAHNSLRRRDVDNADHWVMGIFFFDRSDSRFFVPKRFGFGWTPNFAHPASWLVLALPLVIALIATLRR